MSRGLLLSVRFYDGRYHGAGDWPPAPARLFQALVAGAACGHALADRDRAALAWLECLQAPLVAAPSMHIGQAFTNFVPNNDLDAVSGDLRRVGEIRVGKVIRPRIFNAEIPFLYGWAFAGNEGEDRAEAICALVEKVFRLGRGVDMAWAWGEILGSSEIEARLSGYEGVIHRPGGDVGKSLPCPQAGSLVSLIKRFEATRRRFLIGASKQQLFVQPPKPRFAIVAYNSPPRRLLFDVRGTTPEAPFAPWPFTKALAFVAGLRDGVANRLKKALPDRAWEVDRIFIGRDATEADKAERVRIVPLPSIGHEHADHAIRRVLIEIPPNCSLRVEDISWGFSALDVGSDRETGEIWSRLVPTDDDEMLRHFGSGEAYRIWWTVTPAALPRKAARRRIEPSHIRDRAEQKGPTERIEEEARAASAVRQALRHAQIDAPFETIRVQREPFGRKGARAEAFAEGSRFAKERLWHVEMAFAKPIHGPLVLGDGRYLGLGLFAPARETRSIFAFTLNAAKVLPGHEAAVAAAARRAVMARVQKGLERGTALPAFFSGHEANGAPHRPGHHAHLFYAVDLASARLVIMAPHVVEHRDANRDEREYLQRLEQALADFTILRAGKAGLFKLSALSNPGPHDQLCGLGRIWVSATPYRLPKSSTQIESSKHGGFSSPPKSSASPPKVLETQDGEVIPVDIKAGKRPHMAEGAYLPERVQICVQGLLLRDAGYRCSEGALFFVASRERVRVAFDEELVASSLRAASELRLTIASGRLPPPLDHSPKCPRCSLLPVCLPDEVNWFKSVAIPRTPPPAASPALPLYVQKPGARITKKDFTLVVQSEGEADQTISLDEISELVLAGPVSLTTPAVHELLRRDTPVAWMSSGFWFLGSTGGQGPRSAKIRTAQYQTAHDKARALSFARELVAAKIKNQRTILRRNWRGPDEVRGPLLERLNLLVERTSRAENSAHLLGLEGEASALYFRAFPHLFTEKMAGIPAFSFENRNRRPPADPVNACLSLCYALLTRTFTAALAIAGLDPWKGFYHVERPGRPALALDLIEPFRPILADSAVLMALNNGELAPNDFVFAAGGCNLRSNARRALIGGYERRPDQETTHPLFGYQVSMRRLIQVQARLFARFLLGEVPIYPHYVPR